MNLLKISCKELSKYVAVILLLVFFYNLFIHLYIYLCVPDNFWSPFKLLLNTGSPMCLFINKIQYNLSNMYVYIWYISGTTIIYGFYSCMNKIVHYDKKKIDKYTQTYEDNNLPY